MRPAFVITFGICGLLLFACNEAAPPVLLATTTSVANSGLLDQLLPSYPDRVRVIQSGSGRALALLGEGHADTAISHAPAQEAAALARNLTWYYRKVLFNRFLIVGPVTDPAAIAGMTDAAAAMKRIIDSGQRFLSRGDESGTHERERELWKASGVPGSRLTRVVVVGAGMGQTLRTASATNGYTLTDSGTFTMLSHSLQLRELVTADPRLVNTYAVLADTNNTRGLRFAKWFAEGAGRDAVLRILSTGQIRGFTIWPAARPGTKPDATPF